MNKYILFSLFILITSCGDDKLKKVEVLNEFRILGVSSTTPEVAPGGSSAVRLIVSDVNGGGRTISGTVQMCIDPGVALGAVVKCDHDPSTVNTTYTIDTVNDVDLGSANLFTGQATQSLAVNVPATILVGRNTRDQFNGVGYLIIFQFEVDGKQVKVFKRIIATNRASLNSNPTLSAVVNNDVAITSKPTAGDRLGLTVSGQESYEVQNIDGTLETRTENFEAAWYITSGEINRTKVLATDTISFKTAAPSTSMVILVLVRDERGGLAFKRELLP